MEPVQSSEILAFQDYEIERRSLRPRMMALKARRRVAVGEHLTFLFENRETVRYQIQEMMRIERIVDPAAIRHELDTYNELIPFRGELSASLLIEYPDERERDRRLRELLGLEQHVWIEVAGFAPSRARFDTRQIATDRISSVQYVKFTLSPEERTRWGDGARLFVDHPRYRAETRLSPEQISELARDFD